MQIIFELCNFLGAQERSVIDCRTKGCGKNGECLREGAEFVCRCIPGTEGDADVECQTSEYLILLCYL